MVDEVLRGDELNGRFFRFLILLFAIGILVCIYLFGGFFLFFIKLISGAVCIPIIHWVLSLMKLLKHNNPNCNIILISKQIKIKIISFFILLYY